MSTGLTTGNILQLMLLLLFLLFLFFWLSHEGCGLLLPQSGIETVPPEVEVQSLNCWTTREALIFL